MRSLLFAALSLSSASAFVGPSTTASMVSTTLQAEKNTFEELPKVSAVTASLWAASTQIASAAGPDWGIFEVSIWNTTV